MNINFKNNRSIPKVIFGSLALAAFMSSVKANALTITTNTTWTTSQNVTGDLVIDNNATLTITGAAAIISVTENIDVKPGCTLIVENDATVKTGESMILENYPSVSGTGAELEALSGAVLTSNGNLWNGVQVWGPQAYGEHGEAKAVFNNATVEKATIGVATYKTDGTNIYNESTYTHKGGTIQADNTLFKNNKNSVRLIQNPSYLAQSFNGPVLMVPSNSPSYFKLCHFLINMDDNPFYPITDIYFDNMITVEDAKGVSILGCLFEDQTNYYYTTGIEVANSDIRVAPATTTLNWGNYYITYTQPSTFLNMIEGVDAVGPGTFSRLIVQQAHFDNNEYPISILGQNNSVLVNNNMTNLAQSFDDVNGIETLGSSGYTIENNDINSLSGSVQGMYILNSGEQYNEIYKNTINNAGYSIISDGENRSLNGNTGLEILCNNFHESILNSTAGIGAINFGSYPNAGIATYQGIIIPGMPSSNWIATGNLFASQPGPAYFDGNKVFKDDNTQLFIYSYSNANPYEDPVYANVPLTVASPNTCPTHSFPFITYPLFLNHLRIAEQQISELNAKETFTHNDSLALSGWLRIHQQVIDSMMMTYMYGDSEEVHYDSMALALEQVQYGYYNKVKLAGVYVMQLRYDDAINLLQGLPAAYSLTEDQATDVNNMADMYTVLDTLAHNGHNWDTLSDAVKANVESVAGQSGAYAPPVAKYLLKRYENIWPETTHLPLSDETMSYRLHNENSLKANKIYPSPATDYVMVNLDDKGDDIMQLFDRSGKKAFEVHVHSGINTINIRSLASGIYFAQIIQNGHTIYQQKIIKK